MIGEYLKGLRAQANMSLKDIATKTRVRREYLEAIEEERFEKLSADIYIKGYIRAYLKALSVDPAEGLRLYNEQTRKSREAELRMQEPEVKPFLPIRQLLYTAIALIAIAVGVFFFYQDQTKSSAAKNFTAADAMISKNIANTGFKDEQPAVGKPVIVKAPKSVTVPVTVFDVKSADTSVAVKHNLSLEVLEATWISITIDGKDKKAMTLMPGDTAHWAGEDNFSLKLGNAGGVRVTFDGKNLGVPGPRGSVLTVKFPQ
ncbi:helix-turn-helix domain-containing protein [Candidatus Magnetobacterium casense]|uniref:Helix-turn-helix domain-containing protein n=1 Tax=Candidatus Magnetobacterium casense TaxID=1455061 RepID=A0ABS6RWJ1_9BACT|nr:RodZ domain-containing protein [Candidatus Magnetobacterium casensis]MBV6340997.1 helix-turn-helix domain-containing protein [Candidatus Magnetobacterium casensis]